jgi:cytochrome c553
MVCLSACSASAADASAPGDAGSERFFESKIRPLLVARCYECHGSESKAEGNLRLDSLSAILRGGDRGPAVKPGDVKGSLLIDAVNHGDVVQMPPKSKLPAAEIADLAAWVAAGAPWPNAHVGGTNPALEAAPTPISNAARAFWAFQPPAEPAVPEVKNAAWPRSPIDRLVLAPLEARGLSPAAPADKRTLIRRATFDLHGLPPTPEEVAAFLADDAPGALARVVDRLLASPRYGERWGRHWLDIARYADSNGMDENMAMAHAWRYRDYVVGAFNKDTPYDRFIREQLAGDLLGPCDEATRLERLTATGFLVLGPKMLAEDDPVKMEMDIIDEQVDTIGRAFMGLTLGCARCHDHKFDPIPTADYYALAGIFKSTKTMANHSVVAMWSERPLATREEVARSEAHQQQIASKSAAIKATETAANDQLLGEARGKLAEYLLAADAQQRQQQALADLSAELKAGKLPAEAIIIEAENYARGNVVRDSATYGQGIGVIYNAGPLPNIAEYDLTLPSAGTYQVALRYAAAESRPLELSLDGQRLSSAAAAAVTGSWQPDGQTWSIEAVVPLAAGRHVLRLERNGPLPHVDKLALLPARFTRDAGTWHVAGQPASDAGLNPVFLRQWSEHLARTRDDANSVLRVWHLWRELEQRQTPPLVAADTPVAAALLAAPRPTSLGELATRYAQLCAQADAESRRDVKPGQAGKKLADATQEAFRQLLVDPAGPYALPKQMDAYYAPVVKAELATLKEQLTRLEKSKPHLDYALAVEERKPEDLHVHIRGSHLTQGPLAPRRFPRVLAGESQPPLGQQSSGRRELAEWLARPDHPLTSRVMVNRIWQGHFGEGLVRSPDNFGSLGERPDNQPLLDWLARRFVESGWSIKAMHRLIMLSNSYQMSTAYNESAAVVDPENRLLWRMNRRRLEVEEIRDAILAASGQVDWSMGGTLLTNANHTYVTSTASTNNVNYQNERRSVYLPVVRSAIYEVFSAFDFADPSTMSGKRPSTTVAPQALFMMNSPLVERQTRAMAAALLAQPNLDDAGRVGAMYERIYSRRPSDAEITRAMDFMGRYQAELSVKALDAAEARLRAWQALCRVVFSANEFIYLE